MSLFAGDDAHGNFNRFRQVKLPMLALHERCRHLFGQMLTHIVSDAQPNAAGILQQLKQGPVCVSDGPALEVSVVRAKNGSNPLEKVKAADTGSIKVRFASTPEFGSAIELVIVTKGAKHVLKTGQQEERIGRYLSSWRDEFILPTALRGYVRAELTTKDSKGRLYRAFTGIIPLENVCQVS